MSEFESASGFLAPAPEDLAPFFPAYEIHSLIATGGMGAVYHAVQISLNREVAIKILPAEFSSDESFCQNFEAEAKAMAKLNHPNLIGVFDFGEANGMLFIVMEYVPGLSLHDASHGAALDPAEVMRLIKKIASGLAHAHDNGVLHRDIKPANILLDQHGQPKIGDFGLARPVDLKVQVGEVIYGTPGYTAPEVLVPPHHADQRADIFSLGVMLHELLTGKLPEADPRTPSAICHCDARLDAVVRKSTQSRPDLRYQSASHIADDIEKIENSAGPRLLQTAAASPGRGAPMSRHAMQARTLTSAKKSNSGLLVVVLLLAVAFCAYLLRGKLSHLTTEEAPKPKPQEVVPPSPDPKTGPNASTPGIKRPAPTKQAPGRSSPVIQEQEPIVNHQEPEPQEPIRSSQTATPSEPVVSTPAAPTVAKLNVSEFLKNAQLVMIRKSAFDVKKRGDALQKNITEFRRDGKRLIRKCFDKHKMDQAEKNFDTFVALQTQSGNRIGNELPRQFARRPIFQQFFEDFQKNETRIDAELVSALSDETQTYVQALEDRVKKLREENDPVAADEIQSEIDQVKQNSMYFVEMVISGNQ